MKTRRILYLIKIVLLFLLSMRIKTKNNNQYLQPVYNWLVVSKTSYFGNIFC